MAHRRGELYASKRRGLIRAGTMHPHAGFAIRHTNGDALFVAVVVFSHLVNLAAVRA
jgi:hypothetical protein